MYVTEPQIVLHTSLFDDLEFRRWIRSIQRPERPVDGFLPGPMASLAAVITAGLDELARQGLLDNTYWIQLRDKFPRRAREIDLVASSAPGLDAPGAPPGVSASPGSQPRLSIQSTHGNTTISVGGHLLLGDHNRIAGDERNG